MSRKRVALLDVNLLVALFDPDHIHHELAHDWFSDNRLEGWATCPITENGLVRVLVNPRYGSPVSTVSAVVERLHKFRASGHHEFWPDELSICGSWFKSSSARGHRQLTDVYLLALAQKNGGRLATFDQSVPVAAVNGATRDMLAVVAPVDEDRS
jgi:toxin-antitoxin system PIN domain toxin